jgi:hypothetical protein
LEAVVSDQKIDIFDRQEALFVRLKAVAVVVLVVEEVAIVVVVVALEFEVFVE